MTIIVALLDGDNVIHMGGDSSASNDSDSIDICGNEKIFHRYSFMYGICGSFRIMNIVRYIFDPPEFTWYDNDTPMHFMVQCFVPMLIKVLKTNKCLEKDNNIISMDATIIVGFKGNLFVIDSDFQVRQLPPENFFAIGSGAEAAKGSLFTSYYNSCDSFESIEYALQASMEFSKSVKGPLKHISSSNTIEHVFL